MIANEEFFASEGILAIGVFRPHAGMEQDCLSTLKLLYQVIRRKKYGRDLLLRDPKDGCWIAVRFWASEEARSEAQHDPEVLRLWERLGHLCSVEKVRESLEIIETDETSEPPVDNRVNKKA